jgi:hypothetical protein
MTMVLRMAFWLGHPQRWVKIVLGQLLRLWTARMWRAASVRAATTFHSVH